MRPAAELTASFFRRDTAIVARELLGKRLVRRLSDSRILEAEITETEAYRGYLDRASHGSRGLTDRNRAMFRQAGTIYIYVIYGVHHCLNLVTEEDGFPAAVLIRSARLVDEGSWLRGPALVCRGLQIDRRLNGLMLGQSDLAVEDGEAVSQWVAAHRVGVGYAGQAAGWGWRYLTPAASRTVNARLTGAEQLARDAGF